MLILISNSRKSIFLLKQLKCAYTTDHVLDYITPESQNFSQNAPIISSMFYNFLAEIEVSPPLPKRAYNIEHIFDFLGHKLQFWPKS